MSVTVALLGITIFSFALGLGRDLMLAYRFGSSTASDAFFLALLLPMVVESLFGFGLRDALVREEQRSEGAGRRLGLAAWVALLVAALVLLFALPARTWIAALAPGWSAETIDAATGPYLVGVLLVAVILPNYYLSGLYGARRSLVLPGLRSVLFNLFAIAALLTAGTDPTWVVAGYGTGYLLHTLLLWWRRPSLQVRGQAAPEQAPTADGPSDGSSMSQTMLAVLAFAVAGQAMIVAERWFASFLPQGALSHLSYAYRTATIPVVLLSLTLIAVLYPLVVSRKLSGDDPLLARTISTSLHALCGVLVAATACLLAVSTEITELLFGRGAFDEPAIEATASALGGYAYGLAALGVGLFASRCLVALGRGRDVIGASLAGLTVTIGLDALLVEPLGVEGLALAMSAGVWVQAFLMLAAVRRAAPPGSAPLALLGWLPIGVLCYLAIIAVRLEGMLAAIVAPPLALLVAVIAGQAAGFKPLDVRRVI